MKALEVMANAAANVTKVLSKNSSTVLTIVAVGGVVTTAYLTAKASIKASKKLEKMHYESEEEPTAKEIIKEVGPDFIPPVLMGMGTIACIFGAQSINIKRQAALATAYSIAKGSSKEFEEKAKEVVGKGKVQKIKDEIAKDKILKNPVEDENIIQASGGDVLFYDAPSNRYFKSDVQTIRKVENDLNRKLITGEETFVELNDLYFELGLPQIQLAKGLGWSIQFGDPLEIAISTQMTESGIPCGVIDYDIGFTFDTRDNY